VTVDPYCTIAEDEGIARTIVNMYEYDPMPVYMAATPEFIDKHPAAVVDYLKAWLDVGKDFKQNPRKTNEVIYSFFTSKGYTMSRDTFGKAMANVEMDIGFPADTRTYLQQIAEGLFKEKKIGAIPDWNKALRPDFMTKAR
jgi:ABC-type nitrate/sulfonate/bicarbonate transport system substrate-binding protein